MRTPAITVKTLLIALAACATACSGEKTTPTVATPVEGTPTTLNIRYVDMDSIASQYNLATEFAEAQIKAIQKIENARQTRGAEIQRFGSQIEEKMRANGYLSEASYNADVNKLQQMQQSAQSYLDRLQQEAQESLMTQQQEVTDSIENFIKDYNSTRGYDAILLKGAGVWFNPSLDITKEVVEGLNARYVKVEK